MESKTEAFRRSVIKRLYRQSLPQWVGKLKGHGFYVIHKKYDHCPPHVEKGVVGDVIVSGIQVTMERSKLMAKGFEEQMLRHCRKELVVKVNLYKAPFDVIKHKNRDSHGISQTGYLGTYSLMDLYRTKADAMEGLGKWGRRMRLSEIKTTGEKPLGLSTHNRCLNYGLKNHCDEIGGRFWDEGTK